MFFKLVSCAYAPGTVANFKSQWKNYINFCLRHGLQIFPPVQDNITRFYTYLVSNLKAYASLQNYESAINMFYRLYGFNLDNGHILTKVLNMAAKKQLSTVPATKIPLEISHLCDLAQVIDRQNPLHFTWLTAVNVGFMALLRRSNICPPSVAGFDPHKHLVRSDIVLNTDSITVNLRWSKTNQSADGVFSIPIASSNNSKFDPPAMYKEFVARYPVYPSDPCFSFYYHGKLFILTQSDLARFLDVFLQKAGHDTAGITTHSIRKGGTNLLHRAGVDLPSLMHHGTWSSDAYKNYLCFNQSDKLKVTKTVYKFLNL